MKVCFFDRAALEQRLKMADVLDVVEGVYKSKAEGKTVVWPTVTHNFEDRGAVMDIRSGYDRGSEVYGAKLLATFPGNDKLGLPPFSGILVAMDGKTGLPKGIMDASFITSMRTGAAAAVSARALARPESDTLLVLGTGRQSLFMIGAALTAMPNIKTVYCAEPMNLDAAKPYAAACPQRMQEMFGLDTGSVQFLPVSDLAESVGKADIIITITRATKPLISRDWVKPGTHLSCIGADMPGKEEVDPAILRDAIVYVDDVDQCVNAGECELAVKGGYMTREHISGQIGEVLLLTGESMESFFEELKHMTLGYPRCEGTPRTRKALSGLYKNVAPDEIILCHGGTGANATVCYALIESSDNVISIMPNYQQFFSIPRSIGAELREVDLKIKDGYKLDLSEVRAAADKNTKAILFTNPNNPTGSVLTLDEMNELVEIAKSVDAWIICDEMYRGLDEEYMPSFADLYDKAIVTASSSKIYSMAGTRVGWIVCHDAETRKRLFNWRSYDSICGGVFDEWIFAIALEHVDKIFERSRGIVNANKTVIDKWIEKNPYLHQYADAHGTTYLVHYDLDVPAEKFCDDLLDQKGVLVCHGDCFNIPHSFRITLSHAHQLEEGLRRIDEYIDELVAQGKAIKN